MTARIGQYAKYIVLLFFAFLALYPIFLMIVSPLKSNLDILTSPLGLPSFFSLDNYIEVWEKVNFEAYMWNSIYVSGMSVFFILFISSLAAFYLSRYSFRWNSYVLFFFMLGLMLPMKLAILPLYMIMLQLQLLDTLTSLVILYVALATVGIVHLIGVWNDFFYPLIFVKCEELSTIPLGVLKLFGEYDTEWNMLFASLTISSMPMIIAFLFASKQFIEGLTSGAIK
ncbi:carbohydrate ABC transporter permease [Brevibacillus fortis]|uniref:carbohydrate ABC transporter permease n=1 Tax=Brevibacillus fortis TaxID=2126352 RepID=UPI002E1F6859|nr:carbohydrate ABC transporter permease [Brevibacillus fortis]